MHLSQLESAAVWEREDVLADERVSLEPATPVCVCITHFLGFSIFVGLVYWIGNNFNCAINYAINLIMQ